MSVRPLIAAGLAGVLGLVGSVALAQTAAPAAKAMTEAAPAGTDDADRTLFEGSCSSCHALEQVTDKHHTTAEWQAIVQQMIGYGATPTPEQADRIVRYLAAHYGADGTSPTAPSS